MASTEIGKLKDIVMNVVNGLSSPKTILVQQSQDRMAKIKAELEYTAKQTPIILKQQAEIGVEIAKLEAFKIKNIALIEAKTYEVMPIDIAIADQEQVLEIAKKAQQTAKDVNSKIAAIAKAHGKTYNEPKINGDKTVEGIRNAIKKQKEISNKIHDSIKTLEAENRGYDEEILKKQYELKILAAQLNPLGALMEARKKLAEAQASINEAKARATTGTQGATTQSTTTTTTGTQGTTTQSTTTTTTGTQGATPTSTNETSNEEVNSVEQAEKKLEEAKEEEAVMQQVSDEHDKAVEQIVEKNEPKMMQLRAEFQIMESSVNAINYLVQNITTLITAASASIGANGAGPVPAIPTVTIPLGNILYGYAWAILANAKAASVRFMAIAQEIDYEAVEEIPTINSIAAAEGALMGLSAIAPAGASLK